MDREPGEETIACTVLHDHLLGNCSCVTLPPPSMQSTLPKEFRALAWQHQKAVYNLLFQCAWETLQSFSLTDKQLKGIPGVIAVLHTHSRALNFHPYIHSVMPAAVIDKANRLWRKKEGKYLFDHKAQAKVFRAKMLADLIKIGIALPAKYPDKWVVDCKSVGSGNKALVYLGRYLYRGVIRERDILSCQDGQVTFRYIDSETGETKNQEGVRHKVFMAGITACFTQRFSPCQELWVFAPES